MWAFDKVSGQLNLCDWLRTLYCQKATIIQIVFFFLFKVDLLFKDSVSHISVILLFVKF